MQAVKALFLFTAVSLLTSTTFVGQPVSAEPASLTVAISLAPALNDGNIEGSTNLPNGTKMQASLQPPLTTCRPNCGYVWEGNFTVTNGHFSIGPLNVARGVYTLEITTPLAELEPVNVRSIIGSHGENLRGPYLKAELVPGGGPTIDMTANVTISGSHTVQNNAPAQAQTDEVWRPNPREAYGPSTYCNWNRTGLPPAQQKICAAEDQKSVARIYKAKPGEVLTTLIPSCQSGGALSCSDDLYQKVWRRIEADNGEVTKIDMNSIEHFNNGTIDVAVYTYVPNTTFDPTRLRRLHFDCHGHFMDNDNMSAMMDAAPRSVAGEVAAIVCAGAKDTRMEDANKDNGAGESPAEYCAGFSAQACDRIKAVFESKRTPAFCKPGFAVVGNEANKGLTPEQIRMCYMAPPSR